MGLISGLLGVIFGNNRNVIKETAEVFRANAEEDTARLQQLRIEALNQFAREYESKNDSAFNRFMEGLNRVPRPALAHGTLGLFIVAMIDPIWFAARMQGISLVPEPLWWLLGVVVSFYFGARHQIKSQQFQKSIAVSMARTGRVAENLQTLSRLSASAPGMADTGGDATLNLIAAESGQNPALEDWHAKRKSPATM